MYTDDFDQLLFRIKKIYTENTNENLKRYNVTLSDMSFLIKLNENDKMTQTELAESRSLNSATIARALDRLEKKGFVMRENDMGDKRKKNIVLTQKGKKTVSDILVRHENFKNEVFSEFNDEEYLNLIKYLNMLLDSLEDLKND